MQNEQQKQAEAPKISCPNCGSTQISANNNNFVTNESLAGLSTSGSVMITCLNCGYQWSPGHRTTGLQIVETDRKQWKFAYLVMGIVFAILTIAASIQAVNGVPDTLYAVVFLAGATAFCTYKFVKSKSIF